MLRLFTLFQVRLVFINALDALHLLLGTGSGINNLLSLDLIVVFDFETREWEQQDYLSLRLFPTFPFSIFQV